MKYVYEQKKKGWPNWYFWLVFLLNKLSKVPIYMSILQIVHKNKRRRPRGEFRNCGRLASFVNCEIFN